MDIIEDLVINKTRHVILARESTRFLVLMLERAMKDTVGDASVQRARIAGENVYVIGSRLSWHQAPWGFLEA